MKTSKPPFIATWLLDRFAADSQLDAVAGDLLEQYRLGRSRLWYWREVITAITVGTWTAFRDHTLVMLRALVLGYVLMFTFGRISNPFWPSILTPLLASQYYVILVHVVILLIVGPLCAFVGWIVAQSARQCRIPAVLAFVMSFLVLTLITDVNLMIREGARTELLLSMLMGLPTLTIMTLFGGGLLTGSPKRSMPIH